MALKRLTSIHGRRLGISSSGAIIQKDGYPLMPQYSENISSSAATLAGSGLSVITSGTGFAAMNLTVPAPQDGVIKTIQSDSSASSLTFNTTSANIQFGSSIDSSALVFSAIPTAGLGVVLQGKGSSEWRVLSRSVHSAVISG